MIIINVMVGIWWGAIYIDWFQDFRTGRSVGEPSVIIANIEFALAIVLTAWFLFQAVYWIRKFTRR